jgi:hypothetical protein
MVCTWGLKLKELKALAVMLLLLVMMITVLAAVSLHASVTSVSFIDNAVLMSFMGQKGIRSILPLLHVCREVIPPCNECQQRHRAVCGSIQCGIDGAS